MAIKTRTKKTSKGERKSSAKNKQTPLALVLMGKGMHVNIHRTTKRNAPRSSKEA